MAISRSLADRAVELHGVNRTYLPPLTRLGLSQGRGVAHVSDDDARFVRDLGGQDALVLAYGHLRSARKLARRAAARGAMKRRRATRERGEAIARLGLAAVLCAVQEVQLAGLDVTVERVARIRERVVELVISDPVSFLSQVEAWVEDLDVRRARP